VGRTWATATFYGEVKARTCKGSDVDEFYCMGRFDVVIDAMFIDALDLFNQKPGNQDMEGCTPYRLWGAAVHSFVWEMP